MRLSGLKLWPVSTSDALVEAFQRGRPGRVELGRGGNLLPEGVAEVSRLGRPKVDMREVMGFRPVVTWASGAGKDEFLRFG